MHALDFGVCKMTGSTADGHANNAKGKARTHNTWRDCITTCERQPELSLPVGPQGCNSASIDADKSKEEYKERRNDPAQNESPEHGGGLGKECSVCQNRVKEWVAQTSLQSCTLAHHTEAVL